MINKNKLKGIIVGKGYSQNTLAPIIGMSKNTLSAKINGRSEFTVDDVDKICKALNITDPAEKCNIFLD